MQSRLAGGAALLLFGSGCCALMYQTVWFREFRLIFGSSTPATAAVLAIFMAGLGLGSAILGGRAERHPRPLLLYGLLEVGIALAAAVSPFIVAGAAWIYVQAGGTLALGSIVGNLLRLVLGILVMGLCAFFMGGTLPAIIRAAIGESDKGRRGVAFLYGINTLGAVAGTALSTFFLLELLGNRMTIWTASALNLLIALLACAVGGRMPALEAKSGSSEMPETSDSVKSVRFQPVYAAAFLSGMIFFAMEMVWYRLLSPLLGGSTFTFGLILAIALLGIGVGGAFYAVALGRRQAQVRDFGISCGLMALALAIPFAMGDGVALFALLTSGLREAGFGGAVLAWALVALLVVFPAAAVAGAQFPILISLLGSGRDGVANQVGRTYAWNTAGAITGVLASGFGLLPLLSAPVLWRVCVGLLVLLAAGALLFSIRKREKGYVGFAFGLVCAFAAVAMICLPGATAFWRHSPIGAGRISVSDKPRSSQDLTALQRFYQRSLVEQIEGRESGIGLLGSNGYSFVLNGKSDGNAIADAGTQVMCGLVGAALLPDPKSALVIGLGTGSTAGWLAEIFSMQNVDVVELEPGMDRVATLCAPVNQNVMKNPKVRIVHADAREMLLTSRARYDLIVSEPSNPFRAGIASLFTREFYLAARERLNPGGIFVQWVQAYEVDAATVRTVMHTVAETFPFLEIWQTQPGDLLLIGSMESREIDPDFLRQRLDTQPWKDALRFAWRTEGLEGFLSHFVANRRLVDWVAEQGLDPINTDDRNSLEFGFARMVGRFNQFEMEDLQSTAVRLGALRPALTREDRVDWEMVENLTPGIFTVLETAPPDPPHASPGFRQTAAVHNAHLLNQSDQIIRVWEDQKWAPSGLVDFAILARALVEKGDDRALPFINLVEERTPVDGLLLRWILLTRKNQPEQAMEVFGDAMRQLRTNPWVSSELCRVAMETATQSAGAPGNEKLLPGWLEAISQPFAVHLQNENRMRYRLLSARRLPEAERQTELLEILAEWEPSVPWEELYLVTRAAVYNDTSHPLAAQSLRDYLRWKSQSAAPFDPKKASAASDPAPSK